MSWNVVGLILCALFLYFCIFSIRGIRNGSRHDDSIMMYTIAGILPVWLGIIFFRREWEESPLIAVLLTLALVGFGFCILPIKRFYAKPMTVDMQ
jgi:hypothetical protein